MTIKIGVHVGRASARVDTAENVRETCRRYGFRAVQIFTMSPQRVKEVDMDYDALRDTVARMALRLYIHSSYLVNPWNRARAYNAHFSRVQLEQAKRLGAVGVIFHIPKADVDTVAAGVKALLARKPRGTAVVLENRATRPDPETSYATPDQINRLVAALLRHGVPRREIHFAIDTAHLYCSGVALQTRRDAEAWLRALRYPDTIRVWHLNGNSSLTRSDRHTVAFTEDDRIWGPHRVTHAPDGHVEFAAHHVHVRTGNRAIPFRDSGVAAIMAFSKKYGCDIILECDFENERVAALRLARHARAF